MKHRRAAAMRAALAVMVAIGLAPGTVVRTAPRVDRSGHVAAQALADIPARIGPFAVAGAWWLRSRDSRFGGYSALTALAPDRLLAVSDTGTTLTIDLRRGAPARFAIGEFALPGEGEGAKRDRDIESLTRDPATGRLWAGLEFGGGIERRGVDLSDPRRVRPVSMKAWDGNSGPEAMTRLADGRFVVLSEGRYRGFGTTHPAAIFSGDPVTGARAERFAVAMRDGYRPVDMAQLPDGRVLILGRGVTLGPPPGFRGMLLLADPAAIRPGKTWRPRPVARLRPPLPSDNYEGLAIQADAPEPGDSRPGGVTMWLISDDNTSALQRTLLLKLGWPVHR